MKRFLIANFFIFIFSTMTNAQPGFNYEAAWKKADNLFTKQGLTESALKEVQQIYLQAKKDKNESQIIKSLLYRITLRKDKEEEGDLLSVNELEKEQTSLEGAAHAIVTSLLAEAYLDYLQNNRWKLYDRTNTVSFKKEDINTWTITDLHQKISSLYLQSISQQSLLQQTRLEIFDVIITKGNMRFLRPTLYDLLVHRAIDYFESDENDLTKPADAFEIHMAGAFDPVADFIKLKLDTNDSNSLHHKALLLYQQLLSFHVTDKNPAALIDADLKRIQFVERYSTSPEKKKLYQNALSHLLKQYNYQPVVSQAAFLLANDYADYAGTYDFKKHKGNDQTNPRNYYIKAIELCNKILEQQEESEGKTNCFNLVQEILEKRINLVSEKVNLPGKPFRTLIEYRNTKRVWIRIVKINEAGAEDESRWEDSYWKKMTSLPVIQKADYTLPATDDFQPHKTEIRINSLPEGYYAIIVSATENFDLNKNLMAIQYIHVSNIAWMYSGDNLIVVHRETGAPLANAQVTFWNQEYDNNLRKYVSVKKETQFTNQQGLIRMKNRTNTYYNNQTVEVKYGADVLHLSDRVYNYIYGSTQEERDEVKNRRLFFFTDRSIYRPGQIVYFKGILTTKDASTGKVKVVEKATSTISLYDANGEVVDSLTVTSNEFGSFSGTFTLPKGKLSGNYHITDKGTDATAYFSVEEYKRPQFFVEYEPIKNTFHINETISIKGFAKAYAGNTIGGAKVSFRVERKARFPYPWLCWKWGWPNASSQVITNGTTTTKEDGSFEIPFTAIPDNTINKALEPVFEYTVTADITDLNGETRTGETQIAVSYKSMQISVQTPQYGMVPADSFKSVSVTTQNTMGVFVKSKVGVRIYKLAAPDRLIRERYWDQPDQFIIDGREYRSLFPNDEYNDESQKESWKRKEKVFEKTDSTKADGVFSFGQTKFTEGWYVIEASAYDADGTEIKDQAYVQLVNSKTMAPVSPTYVWHLQSTQTTEPGQTATISFGSSANEVTIIQQGMDKALQFYKLNKNSQSINLVVKETDRGGIGYNYAFVKNNRFFYFTRFVTVPWSNKELNIQLETFRNKTLPGSKEEWTVTITGKKGEKLAAELLTSMYDASLDQFKKHQWLKPDLFPVNGISSNWTAGGFELINSQSREWDEREWKSFDKRYDELLSLNNSHLLEIGYGPKRMAKMAMALPAAGALDLEMKAPPVADSSSLSVKKEELTKQSAGNVLQIRKNFTETAFFFPDLRTDSTGKISFRFTMPESLTKWKWMLFSHTKDMQMGLTEQLVVTQKELMVQTFAPRFLREGDRFEFTAKITNLTEKEITGQTALQLFNTSTMQPVDGWFQNTFQLQHFTVAAGQSIAVTFRTEVPYNFNDALTYRIIAKGAPQGGMVQAVGDGEENTLPILTNRILVTETLPLPLRGNQTKTFRFDKLVNNNSETLTHHRFTIEFTSNPVWYAVQALPYLMEYPYECSEQTWNRYFANALASHITAKLPKIRRVFEQWKHLDSTAFLSNLHKNEELKSILLEETPWVLEAKSEEQQKKNIALLFDMLKMNEQLEQTINKLSEMQSSGGGFPWFKGGPDDRYITQYIITGIGRLKKMNAVPAGAEAKIDQIVTAAMSFLDAKIKEDYDYLKKHKINLKNNNLTTTQIQYLYMRSFYPQLPVSNDAITAFQYYLKQAKQNWVKQSRYMQGMIALVLKRNKEVKTANAIVKSLKENALLSEESGMYFKDFTRGYYWHEAPVEAQSLMIEVFGEVAGDMNAVADLKTWLLKQKQTQSWSSTVATASACYALLMNGDSWIEMEPVAEIKAGTQTFSSNTNQTEAGTGYFKQTVDAPFIKNEMGEIAVTVTGAESKNSKLPTWGAAYWQYFENLDKITNANSPLVVKKQYFIEQNTRTGVVLVPVEEGTELKVGTKIKVRIEITTDRNLEYVHMKDMRPSCMEPVNVLSGYKWQGGLGYYESTKDASTSFFFSWINKGTYVFEYPLFVTHAGNYSAGITTIQCMYAPEFSSHSEGVRIKVVQE